MDMTKANGRDAILLASVEYNSHIIERVSREGYSFYTIDRVGYYETLAEAKRYADMEELKIVTAYSEEADTTFITKETYEGGELKRIEVVGFYMGPPSEENTKAYIGKLSAEFS